MRIFTFFLFFTAFFMNFSCVTGNVASNEMPGTDFCFSGKGIKIEAESMKGIDSCVEENDSASGGKCVCMKFGSVLSFSVSMEQGLYECLVQGKAFDGEKNMIFLTHDESVSEISTSSPPLGKWELMVRNPVEIELDANSSVNFSIRNPDDGLFMVDFVQLVKKN